MQKRIQHLKYWQLLNLGQTSSSGSDFIDSLSNMFEKLQPQEIVTGCDYRIALGCIIVETLTVYLMVHVCPSAMQKIIVGLHLVSEAGLVLLSAGHSFVI